MFKRKKLPSKPELTETNDFFLNTEIPEQSKSLFFGVFFGPCYLPWGQSEDLSSPTATTFPLQSFPT